MCTYLRYLSPLPPLSFGGSGDHCDSFDRSSGGLDAARRHHQHVLVLVLTETASAPNGATRVRANSSISSRRTQTSAPAAPVVTMPVTPLSSRTTRARRPPTPSTSFLRVSTDFFCGAERIVRSYRLLNGLFSILWHPPASISLCALLTSGLINPKCTAFIGSGVVVHVPSLFNELDTLERKGEYFFRVGEWGATQFRQ